MEPQGPSSVAGGHAGGAATPEDSVAVAYKAKHHDPAMVLLGIYPRSWKLLSTQNPACGCSQQFYS